MKVDINNLQNFQTMVIILLSYVAIIRRHPRPLPHSFLLFFVEKAMPYKRIGDIGLFVCQSQARHQPYLLPKSAYTLVVLHGRPSHVQDAGKVLDGRISCHLRLGMNQGFFFFFFKEKRKKKKETLVILVGHGYKGEELLQAYLLLSQFLNKGDDPYKLR